MSNGFISIVIFVAMAGFASCSQPPETRPAKVPISAPVPHVEPAPSVVDAEPSEPVARFAFTTVDDPEVLSALMKSGADLGSLVSPAWQATIVATLSETLDAIRKRDSHAGVGIRGNIHRLFNRRWLDEGHFELIGLTYRAERTPVLVGKCGDVRLIYRLAYRTEVSGEEVHSRLPMTMLVELAPAEAGPDGCASDARQWTSTTNLSGAPLAAFLLEGPLSNRLVPAQISQVLVNVQIVRWPSAVRPDLGGHAEYSMLAFEPNAAGSKLVPKPLENMPDVKRFKNNSQLKRALLSWIGENLDRIDEGTAIMPDAFLATRAVSVTPRGLSRLANRPFRQIFEVDDVSNLSLGTYRRIGSPQALLRRLDDLTCVGCHQSRTIAGFHWLGVDDDDVAVGNGLFVSRSVPLMADARRRELQTLALARGRTPDFSRPFAERDDLDKGAIGSRCGLGDPGFASWTCADGLVCDPYDAPRSDAVIGVCASPGDASQGEWCEIAPVSPNANPHRDRARGPTLRACQTGVCNINRTGFPGGMCTSGCGSLPDDGTCGVIALLTPFNNCLARKTPFPACLADHVAPAGLRACDAMNPCRDDYVCARTPSGAGGCMPPYFLFQLRVDGHP